VFDRFKENFYWIPGKCHRAYEIAPTITAHTSGKPRHAMRAMCFVFGKNAETQIPADPKAQKGSSEVLISNARSKESVSAKLPTTDSPHCPYSYDVLPSRATMTATGKTGIW
jgi:hypothetical protein